MRLKSIYFNQFKIINGLIFLFTLIALILINPLSLFRYDCRVYWALAHDFDMDGSFNLLSFHEPLRGYFFSLFLYPSYKIAQFYQVNEVIVCRLYIALCSSIIYVWGTPSLYKRFFNVNILPFGHALLGLLMLVLWWEYLTIPLTDVFGLVLLLSSFALIGRKRLLNSVISGMCLYAAINMRLVFIIAIPFLVFLMFLNPSNYLSKVKLIALTILGFLMLGFPQYVINVANFNSHSLFVPTEVSKETGGKNLYFMQLNWGLRMQKYETNIGNEYPIPEVRYLDSIGEELSILNGNKDFESYTSYFEFVIAHPKIVITYIKHFFNGLDITTPKAYLIENIYSRSLFLKWFNFSAVFLGVLGLIYSIRRLNYYSLTLVFMLLSIIAVVLPTAIEVRFFLPLHFIIYFFMTYFLQKISNNEILFSKKKLGFTLLCYLCFVGVCMERSTYMERNLEFKQVLFNKRILKDSKQDAA